MNDFNSLEWGQFENLKELGVRSISLEHSPWDDLTGFPHGAIDGPKYLLELELDSAGLKKLQERLKNVPRSDEEQLKHELNVMHKVLKCEGNNIHQRIDNYLENINNKAKEYEGDEDECEDECVLSDGIDGGYILHYKLKHR